VGEVYTITRADIGVIARENLHLLDLRLDLANHSPTGFEWGYQGSGPAQLALAILADALGDEDALRLYQEFKRQIVSRVPRGLAWWGITQDYIQIWAKGEANGANH